MDRWILVSSRDCFVRRARRGEWVGFFVSGFNLLLLLPLLFLSFLLLMLRGLLEAGDGKPCSCAWNGESACFWKLWRDGWGRGGSR